MAIHLNADLSNPLCKTFKPPFSILVEQALTYPELFEWNAVNNPAHPLFRYYDGHTIREIVYADAMQGVRRVARLVLRHVHAAGLSNSVTPTVAILASSGELLPSEKDANFISFVHYRYNHIFLFHPWCSSRWTDCVSHIYSEQCSSNCTSPSTHKF